MIEEREAELTRAMNVDVMDSEAAEQEFDGRLETLTDFILELTD